VTTPTKYKAFLTTTISKSFQKTPQINTKKSIIQALQHCNLIVKEQVKHLIQKKPQPPSLKAQIKIHKPDNPIRPVINNINAPAYKISKFLVNKLKII
jgi:hypothetical protein